MLVQSRWYEIRIKELLDPEWAEWFAGMEIRQDKDEQTIIAGRVTDQAALHGLLARVRSLNLTLLSVKSGAPSGPPIDNSNLNEDRRRIK
jgi:hypothetical protein